MSCQACPQRATTEAVHGSLRARCCSERCGREIVGGIFPADTGYIRVAAASPLGRAIARETRETGDYRMPAHVAAQLVGALQRIGPKRGADDAELPASTQAATPTGIDWVADLPRDVWGTILPMLDRTGLNALAGVSHGTRALLQSDVGQAEKYRRENTPFNAALHYVASSLTADRRRIIRLAYPSVAEWALARLLLFDTEQIYQLALEPGKYRRLIATLRAEAGRDGDDLFARPIQVPIPPRTLILERRLVKNVEIVTAMPFAIFMYALQHDWPRSSERLMIYLRSYVRAFAAPSDGQYETPATPCFFSYPYLFNLPVYYPYMDHTEVAGLFDKGVDPARTDAGFWFAEMLARTYDMQTIEENADKVIATASLFRFDGPRADGQMSLLYMTKKVRRSAPPNYDIYLPSLMIRLLREHNAIGTELRAPVIMNDGIGNTILHLLCRTEFELPVVTSIVQETVAHSTTPDGIANPPLQVRNARGEIPIETMISEVAAEPDNDDVRFLIVNRVARVLQWFGMRCHPFAQSPIHNKPIVAIAPVEFHEILVDSIDVGTPANDWNDLGAKQYLAYMATQIYAGRLQLAEVAPIFELIIRRYAAVGARASVVSLLRPLLISSLDYDDPLMRWFRNA